MARDHNRVDCNMVDERGIRQRYEAQAFLLNERTRRMVAAAEAEAAGRGGIAAVSRATGIARSTIGPGLAELPRPQDLRPFGGYAGVGQALFQFLAQHEGEEGTEDVDADRDIRLVVNRPRAQDRLGSSKGLFHQPSHGHHRARLARFGVTPRHGR